MRIYPFRGIRVRPAGGFVNRVLLLCSLCCRGVLNLWAELSRSTDTEGKKWCELCFYISPNNEI